MAIFTSLLVAALVAASSVQGATTKCKKYQSGTLITGPFRDKTGKKEVGLKPYAFNSRNELAYYTSGKHANITVEFQLCEPNYAQWTKPRDYVYGRFYIPKLKQCLAVTNSNGAPPYYVAAKPCIPEKEMNTKKSIPFNFFAPVSEQWNNYFWTGGSIPGKKIYQGPEPFASNCRGRFSVNGTNLQHGHNYGDDGPPSVSDSYKEMNRIHMYCAVNKKGQLVTAETVFRIDDGTHIFG